MPIPTTRDAIRDRCLGALVGLAVGDALGTTLEFEPRPGKPVITDMVGGGPFNLLPGQWTDDTAMALALGESLLAVPSLDPSDVMARWLRWSRDGAYSCTGTCFDIGNQIARALSDYGASGAFPPSTDRAGNGGIMRLAPAPILHHRNRARAIDLAEKQSALTHNSAACAEAARVMTDLMVTAIMGDREQALSSIPEAIRTRDRRAVHSSGYVVDTLEAALWAVSAGDGFEPALIRAVNLGDDADTVGAVAGQIAGALWGLSSIPERWLKPLAWRDRLMKLGENLFSSSQG